MSNQYSRQEDQYFRQRNMYINLVKRWLKDKLSPQEYRSVIGELNTVGGVQQMKAIYQHYQKLIQNRTSTQGLTSNASDIQMTEQLSRPLTLNEKKEMIRESFSSRILSLVEENQISNDEAEELSNILDNFVNTLTESNIDNKRILRKTFNNSYYFVISLRDVPEQERLDYTKEHLLRSLGRVYESRLPSSTAMALDVSRRKPKRASEHTEHEQEPAYPPIQSSSKKKKTLHIREYPAERMTEKQKDVLHPRKQMSNEPVMNRDTENLRWTIPQPRLSSEYQTHNIPSAYARPPIHNLPHRLPLIGPLNNEIPMIPTTPLKHNINDKRHKQQVTPEPSRYPIQLSQPAASINEPSKTSRPERSRTKSGHTPEARLPTAREYERIPLAKHLSSSMDPIPYRHNLAHRLSYGNNRLIQEVTQPPYEPVKNKTVSFSERMQEPLQTPNITFSEYPEGYEKLYPDPVVRRPMQERKPIDTLYESIYPPPVRIPSTPGYIPPRKAPKGHSIITFGTPEPWVAKKTPKKSHINKNITPQPLPEEELLQPPPVLAPAVEPAPAPVEAVPVAPVPVAPALIEKKISPEQAKELISRYPDLKHIIEKVMIYDYLKQGDVKKADIDYIKSLSNTVGQPITFTQPVAAKTTKPKFYKARKPKTLLEYEDIVPDTHASFIKF